MVAVFSGQLAAQAPPAAGTLKSRSQQAAYEIRADVLVDALLDQLRAQLVEEARLRQRILAEPNRHVRPAASRALLLAWSRGELETFFDRQLVEIHRRLNRDHPEEVIPLDWLRGRAEKRRPGQKGQATAQALQSFENNFSTARREVVGRQWLDLEPPVARMVPAAAEIERIAAGGRRDLTELRRRLEAELRTQRSSPWRSSEGGWVLFEENQTRIDQALGERLDRGLAELAAQRDILARGEVTGTLQETLERNLRRRLGEHLQRFGGAGFGVFPSVAARIPRRATELMEARLTAAVGTGFVCPELTDQRLRTVIAANPRRHVEYEESSEILRRELPAAIRADLVRHTLERFGEAAGGAPRLARLLAERRWASQLSRSVAECLEASLSNVRADLARRQVATRFPNLRDKVLPEKTILEHRKSPHGPASRVIDAVGIALAPSSEPLLQEAQTELSSTASDLLQEGINAMDQQESLADNLRPRIDEWRQASNSRGEVLQKARNSLRSDWRWRQQQPDNHGARKYRALFHHTEDRLADLVDSAFQRPIKEPPVPVPQGSSDAQPGKKGGGDGKGGGKGGGTGSEDGSGADGGGDGGCAEQEPRIEYREVTKEVVREVPREHKWRQELLGASFGAFLLCTLAFVAGWRLGR
jgi:hypothetical protein